MNKLTLSTPLFDYLKYSEDVDPDRVSLLIYNDINFKVLEQHFFDPDLLTVSTPLGIAIRYKRSPDVIKTLLQHGATKEGIFKYNHQDDPVNAIDLIDDVIALKYDHLFGFKEQLDDIIWANQVRYFLFTL